MCAGFVLCTLAACPALALPTFQVYSPGATAGDYGPDEDTWMVTSTSFDLIVVGNLTRVVSLDNVTLVVSVPNGSTGSISIIPDGGSSPLAPEMWYDTKEAFYADFPFAELDDDDPLDDFNNHYPFQNAVSDFLLFDLDPFITSAAQGLHDYNADDGSITVANNSYGQERLYSVSFSGYDWVHFDVFGQTADGTWKINPASHDTTAVPAPGAILLGSLGVGLVGWLRRRRSI